MNVFVMLCDFMSESISWACMDWNSFWLWLVWTEQLIIVLQSYCRNKYSSLWLPSYYVTSNPVVLIYPIRRLLEEIVTFHATYQSFKLLVNVKNVFLIRILKIDFIGFLLNVINDKCKLYLWNHLNIKHLGLTQENLLVARARTTK